MMPLGMNGAATDDRREAGHDDGNHTAFTSAYCISISGSLTVHRNHMPLVSPGAREVWRPGSHCRAVGRPVPVGENMLDLAMLLMVAVGFAAMAAYVWACDAVTRPANPNRGSVP
jgi:hypothetical protein